MWFKCMLFLAIISYVSISIEGFKTNDKYNKGIVNALKDFTDNEKIKFSFDPKENKFVCIIEFEGITGDFSRIVKKSPNSNIVFGIAKFGKSERTDEYILNIVNNRSLNFNFTYTEMDYNDNGEYYCIVTETKAKSKPIVISKDVKMLPSTIESNGQKLEETAYFRNEEYYNLTCKVETYKPAILQFYQSGELFKGKSITEQSVKLSKRKLPIYETKLNMSVNLKDIKSLDVKCNIIIDETITHDIVLYLKKKPNVKVACNPETTDVLKEKKVNVECIVTGAGSTNVTYDLSYLLSNGVVNKLSKSDAYITVTTLSNHKNKLIVNYEIITRNANFRKFTFNANVDGEIISSEFSLTKVPRDKIVSFTSGGSSNKKPTTLFTVSVLTLSLSLFFSVLN